MNANRILVAGFVVSCMLIAWSEVAEYNQFPRPQRFVGAGSVFVLLGILGAVGAANVAAAMGIGMVLTQVYQLWQPKPDSAPAKQFT